MLHHRWRFVAPVCGRLGLSLEPPHAALVALTRRVTAPQLRGVEGGHDARTTADENVCDPFGLDLGWIVAASHLEIALQRTPVRNYSQLVFGRSDMPRRH